MQTTDNPGLSEDQAVQALLATPETEAEDTEAETPEEAETETDAAPAEQPDTDEDEAETEDADADSEESGEDEDEDDSEEVEEAPALYTVKVDGKEQQVTLDELLRGYAGQSYVQEGMQKNAAERRQAQEALQALQAAREQVLALGQSLQEGKALTAPEPPDARMLDSDPIGYMQADAAYRQAKDAYDRQQSELAKTREEHAKVQAQMMQAFVAQQQAELVKHIPEFADPQKADGAKRRLRDAGTSYGFTEDELGNIMDARMVRVLHDAAQFRALQADTKKVVKKVKTAPPRKSAEPPQAKKAKDARAKLKRTGSVEDAIAYLLTPE